MVTPGLQNMAIFSITSLDFWFFWVHQACFVSFRNKVYFNGAFSPPTCAHAHIAATICSDPEVETGEPEETWVLRRQQTCLEAGNLKILQLNITHLQKGKVIWTIQAPLFVFHATFPGCTWKRLCDKLVHWTLLYTCWFHKFKFWRPGKSKGRPQVVGFLKT